MFSTRSSFARSTLIMISIGGLILLGIVGSTIWLVQQSRHYFDEVVSARAIRSGSTDLLSTLQDAETGQRGYLLSQEDNFLEPYKSALESLSARRDTLRRSVTGRQSYEKDFPRLDQLITQRLDDLNHTVDLAMEGKAAEAIAITRRGAGEQTMSGIREILNNYMVASEIDLQAALDEQSEALATLQRATIIGAGAIVLVLAGALSVIYQHIRDLSRARSEVETLNASLEERVNERTEDLIRANQEIQRFAYIVTHDLRAPLVNIMGFTSELETSLNAIQPYVLSEGEILSEDEIKLARVAAEEDLPEAITFIRSSTKKMDGLINAILKISRDGRRQLKPEPIDLRELLETSAASIQHQVADLDGSIEIGGRMPKITTDKLSLEQIFGNLFDNAVKYASPDRPLHIEVHARPQGPRFIRVEVSDNGRGIAEEDLERIFELFRRSGQQDKPGEGIGLAHVRSLTRNLGGDITVQSEIGKGSTFVLRLPSDLTKVAGV
ncbi:ATP-binding protein [Phyllobacterium sp. 21LDTY02-6]|uniref:sensor histidine kinase n=1 Tax=Phyllobacterium sp. 21LDTY02-6 TaxID=2944903 RepID=UPI002021FF40|nr:ATP-binding protein [Phyllobacterium sp. 21LDTY02-6]MCO4317607.1 ATP-binding protein [Phyllobacterium sp. 21LDTY02-6]